MSSADAVDMDQQGENDNKQHSAAGHNHKHPHSPSTTTSAGSSKRQKTDTSASSTQSDATSTSVFAPRLPAPLYPVHSPERGRCVYSSMSLPAQSVLLRDTPLAMIQFQKNKRRVLACGNCGSFIGSLALQLNTLAATEGNTHTDVAAALIQAEEHLPAIDPADQALSPAVVRCPSGCTELYCSQQCQQSHYSAYHQLLCPGPLQHHSLPRQSYKEKKQRKLQRQAAARAGIKQPPTSPLLAFHRHALRHHQFFIMAAQIVARLTLMERGGSSIANELQALHEYAQKEWTETIDLNEGYDDKEGQKENVGESETAHEEHSLNTAKKQEETDDKSDDGYSPDDEGGQHDHEDDRRLAHRHQLLSHLTHVLTKSYHLLASALYTSVGLPTPHWYSVSFYSHLLGLLRMNNVAVELRSPLVEYVAAVDGLQGSDSWTEVAHTVGERAQRVMQERQRECEWEERNAREEEEDDEGSDEDGDDAGGSDDASSEEEWSDSEDDESFRKEDEDSYQEMHFNWPLPQQSTAAPTVVVVAAPIDQPILSTVPLPGLAPTQQPVAILTPPAASVAAPHTSFSSAPVLSFSSALFPSFHGSALYACIACLNHSCEPNVVVHFERDARPLVLAVGEQGIQAGRECCMTYCDLDGVSRADRWKELEGYGFVCDCGKCKRELEIENADVPDKAASAPEATPSAASEQSTA